MDRKDEIIQMQNEIMQGLLRQRMQLLSEDLWGVKPLSLQNKPGTDKKPGESAAPILKADDKPEPGKNAAPAAKIEEKEEEQADQQEAPAETIDDLKKELHGYIGLDRIKEEVDSLINWIEICKARQEHGLPSPDLSLHMVFSGNPGTGKTMVARLMSRIYKALGVLTKGQLVEVDRSGLVAGYVGQTAIKTAEVIEKAMGGVLFIDEAYALTNRGGTDYGQEAVEDANTIHLPEWYIVDAEGSPFVWAQGSNGKLEKRSITLGNYDEDLCTYVVESGLTPEDYIAFPYGKTVRDGATVEITDGTW